MGFHTGGDPTRLRSIFQAETLPLPRILEAIMGLGLEGVKRDDARTWRCTHMKKMMPDTIIERALSEIEAKAHVGENFEERAVDLDDVCSILMAAYNDALLRHKAELTKAFYKFDEGREGMSLEEFRDLLKWSIGLYRMEIMSDEEISDIYHHIEELADEDDDDANIDEGENFAAAVITCDIDLSYAKFCRNHWSLPGSYTAARYETGANANSLAAVKEMAVHPEEGETKAFSPRRRGVDDTIR